MSFNPQWIVGKTIARVEMKPFRACPDSPHDRRMAQDPEIHFDDGSSMVFLADETETGEYGINIIYRKKRK